ncbi:hypothetical protein [Streptacidiphilus neutrinimicus]|uniref:hypothetical protein n=1 Tax=Streptacidiphilus neutrinimicus TaxID=105420 RepID=UPI0005A94221|nr:hypothetical protein [Streptacidiphilus neutrinimicus]
MFQHVSKRHLAALALSLLIATGFTAAVESGKPATAVADSQWGATPGTTATTSTTVQADSAAAPVAPAGPVDSQWG